MEGQIETTNATKPRYSKEFKAKAAVFLAGVSGISVLVGFGTTLAAAKKLDPKYFNKGLVPNARLGETGTNLALRALGWGTLYAFTGCGILFYSIWKISGATDITGRSVQHLVVVTKLFGHSSEGDRTHKIKFDEFRSKVGSLLPKIPKNEPPQGRTEFSGLNDLLNYLQHQKGEKDK